jgi:acyl carrier protein
MNYEEFRQLLLDWLDDNYHFGDASELVADDDMSFLDNGILDSLGFVQLILMLENQFNVQIDRKDIRPQNFDGMRKIITYVNALPGMDA